MDLQKVYICEECDKKYKHRQSLYNHNKKFHSEDKPNVNLVSTKCQPHINQMSTFKYTCKYCTKGYNINQSRWKHEQKCKINYNNNNEVLKKENELLKKELREIKDQLLDLMNKSCKMHPKTLQKINNQLNNCNITNINIVQFGKEDVMNTLSKKEKLKILNNGYQSFNKLIEYVHFNNKYPQFKNIAITNLKDNIAYKYQPDDNKFIACKKDELLEDLMDIRTIDLEEILNENIDTISNLKVSKLKSSIEKLYDRDNFYNNKKSDIKLLVYNKSDKDNGIII